MIKKKILNILKTYPLLCTVIVTGVVGTFILLKGFAFPPKNDVTESNTEWKNAVSYEEQGTQVAATEKKDTQSVSTQKNTEKPKYEFTKVDQSYFNDALFIGDSRTVGLHDYSGIDNATYYANIGMSIYELFKKPIVEENGGKITVEQALSNHQFGKIYVMLGINELGTGTIDSFMQTYQEAISHLQQLQPNAIIFVEGIMYVKQEKSESDPIFNNKNIKERNDRIKMLADNSNIFYIDVNDVVADATGNLNPAYTYDDVHLLGRYYSVWKDFLFEHGIIRNQKDKK